MEQKKVAMTTIGHSVRKFVSVFVILSSCMMLYIAFQDVYMSIQLNQEIEKTNAEIVQLKVDEEKLNKKKEQLEDDEYVKRYARGKYLLTKEGETIYKLPDDEAEKHK